MTLFSVSKFLVFKADQNIQLLSNFLKLSFGASGVTTG